MPTQSARIEYIDMAKGFCILLVVFAHIHPDLTRYAWGVFFDSFRMPLYFFLSGIFFKRYSGIGEFCLKKINNLIVPLLFFLRAHLPVRCAFVGHLPAERHRHIGL